MKHDRPVLTAFALVMAVLSLAILALLIIDFRGHEVDGQIWASLITGLTALGMAFVKTNVQDNPNVTLRDAPPAKEDIPE